MTDSQTPRIDHYRAEFKRHKQTLDGLTEYLLDEFAQEELRLRAAESRVVELEKAIQQVLDGLAVWAHFL